jgi:hypothetical protein
LNGKVGAAIQQEICHVFRDRPGDIHCFIYRRRKNRYSMQLKEAWFAAAPSSRMRALHAFRTGRYYFSDDRLAVLLPTAEGRFVQQHRNPATETAL